jgi:tetratricopeptide (TPR) repeat protein
MLTTILRRGQLAKSAQGRALPLFFALASAVLLTGCGPPGPTALHKGDRLIQEGDYEGAIAELKDATQLLAHYPPAVQAHAWHLLGLANQDAGHSGPALQAYEEALKLDRNIAAVDYNIGCLQLQQSNYAAAVFALTTYTTLHGSDAEGYLRLGEALAHYGMLCAPKERAEVFRSARSALNAAEKISPSAQTANGLGVLELQSRPGRPAAESVKYAVRQFETALARSTNYPPSVLNLAIVDQQYLSDPRGALERYHQYLALQPLPDNAASVEKVAHQLDVQERIEIVPRGGQHAGAPPSPPTAAQLSNFTVSPHPPPIVFVQPRPVETPKPSPPPQRAPAPPPQRSPAPVVPTAVTKPEPPTVVTPPPQAVIAPPKEQPTARVEPPSNPPAVAPSPPPAPVTFSPPPNPPPANPLPAPASNQPPISEPATAAAPQNEPALTLDAGQAQETTSRPRKTIFDKLNPRNWFGDRRPSPDNKAAGDSAVGNGRERYVYPLPVTPIPGDRAAAERLVQSGEAAQRQNRLDDAMGLYQKAVDTDSTYAQADISLGLAAIDAKDYDTALTALDRALNLQTDSADARYAFAWVLQRKNYFQDAAAELQRLLAQHPDQARAHLLLGNLYAQHLNEPRLAREQYMKTLSLDPDNSQAPTIRNWLNKAQ